GQIIGQPVRVFRTASGREADRRIAEMLERVSLTAAYARRYPDQLSGGERQRVAIARALICDPTVLICDEGTSALDVSVQAAIVELRGGLQRDLGLAMLFITHNLPLVRSIAQRVAVLNQGTIVELGDTGRVLTDPQQPYTRQLLSDTPSLEMAAAEAGVGEPPADAAGGYPDARGPAPGHPDHHGRSASAVRVALSRQPGDPGPGAVLARRVRGGFRRGVHGQPAVLTRPGVVPDRPAALAHPRLRQRGAVQLGDPYLRSLPEDGRLPHRPPRHDA